MAVMIAPMRRLFLAALAAFFAPTISEAEPPPNPLPYLTGTEFGVVTSPARLYSDNVIYAQTHLPSACVGWCKEGVWQTVTVTEWGFPPGVKAVFLSGMLIITHGTTVETADIHIVFRAFGDASVNCTKLLGQTVEAHVGGGQRSMLATWVPVAEDKFQWCYTTSTPGAWPDHASYGVNMSMQAWVR